MAGVVKTVTIVRKSVWGDRRAVTATIALDTGDYAAGGFSVAASDFGLQVIDEIICHVGLEVSATPTAQLYQYNGATGKIRVFQSAAADAPFNEKGAEPFGSGASVRVLVIGY